MLYEILLRDGFEFNPKEFSMFIKTLQSYLTKEKFSLKKVFSMQPFNFEYVIDCDEENKVKFYMQDNTNQNDRFKQSLVNLFGSGADVYEICQLAKYEYAQTLQFKNSFAGQEVSLKLYEQRDELIKNIVSAMSPETRIRIEFNVKRLSNSENKEQRFRMRETDTVQIVLDCIIFIECKNKYQLGKLTELGQTIKVLTESTGFFKIFYRQDFKPSTIPLEQIMNLFCFPKINQRDESIEKFYYLKRNQKTLKSDEFNKGIRIGTSYHPTQVGREIRVDIEQLRKHAFVTGQTGAGKTSVFEEMAMDIIKQKVNGTFSGGFTFFDPAESGALGVINRLRQYEHELVEKGDEKALKKLEELKEKLHYIDFTNEDGVFCINLLDKNVEVTRIKDFFADIFSDENAIHVNRVIINSIGALCSDTERHTINEVYRLIRKDSDIRDAIVERLKGNQYARSYYEFLTDKIDPKIFDPVLNRIEPFYNTPAKRRIFTTGRDNLNKIRQWMDEGHIILVNLATMADYDIRIIIGYMALRYFDTAIRRPANSVEHFFITDE